MKVNIKTYKSQITSEGAQYTTEKLMDTRNYSNISKSNY